MEKRAVRRRLIPTGMLFGTFDGVHMGHCFLVAQALERAKQLYIVVARDATVFTVKGALPRRSERERVQNLKKLFPACRVVLGHPHERMYWVRRVRPGIIFLGYDQEVFVPLLTRELRARKTSLRGSLVRLKPFFPETHKSSRIHAPQILIRGRVVHGKKLARRVGYPTANILLTRHAKQMLVHTKPGIYASHALLHGVHYLAATVVGARAHRGAPLFETHLIGYTGDCYGAVLTISLEKKLRDVKVYTNTADLQKDIRKDLVRVVKLLPAHI